MLGYINVYKILVFRYLAPRFLSQQSPPSGTLHIISFSSFYRSVLPYRWLSKSGSICSLPGKRIIRKCSMPKKNKTSVQKKGAAEDAESPLGPVVRDKSGLVCIAIHAKPGSKQNAITAVSERTVDVCIAAAPSDGEANAELVRYLSKVLELRRSDVVLDKGCRSREKIVKISGSMSPEDVLQKLKTEAAS
ncbi:UPF0235 protein C15orf40 homolog isoform X1 [Paramormyrops kingsleyae]|uniref:UPF0235 protein C15orf40 homolog isoform X1 n=1 Tax=Paramormyrops kingsleyae TaxID=1676925 RepID=UPI003B96A912